MKKALAKNLIKKTGKTLVEGAPKNEGVEKKRRSGQFNWVLKDTLVLVCIGLAFFLFLVLFSYHPADPGFETVSDTKTVLNYGGRTGAWFASFLLYIFGVFAFLVPFGVLMAGMVTLRIREGSGMDYVRFVLSMSGLLILIVAGAGLASLYMDPVQSFIQLPYSAGGVVGYEISTQLVGSVDLLATTLILLILSIIAFSLFSSFSWLTIVDYTGMLTWKLIHFLEPHVQALADNTKSKAKTISKPKDTVDKKAYSKGILNVAGKVKERAKQVAEKTKKTATNITKNNDKSPASVKKEDFEPSISGSTLDKSDINSSQGSSVKVGKKESSNATVPLQESGELPSVELLDPVPEGTEGFSEDELTDLSLLLEQRLQDFGVSAKVEAVQPGPVVTRFEVLPAAGIKVSRISGLAKDLARVLSVKSVRVVDIIPGKAVIGIEIPNDIRDMVTLRDVISSAEFQNSTSPLTIALGKDIAGKTVVADIGKMPHLLVAGTTGSGKSVGVNSMILSMLYKSTPEEVRMIMIDPKMLELSVYEDIPHLLTPVVTDMSEAANALRWCVFEMDRRYQLMAKLGVRNIAGFNAKVQGAIDDGKPIVDPLYAQAANFGNELGEQPPTLESLPYIVVVVDEFADMIMVVGKEVEQLIARIAQKARAAGIHLILATQRPSVNVITGLIKANIPTRISFMVNTKIDSRTILDQGGGEQLLGMGDMLFMPPGSGSPKRVHGAYMTDEEVHRVAEFVKSQGEPQYLESVTQATGGSDNDSIAEDAEQDLLYDQVVSFVVDNNRVSVSLVQRQFKIGYNRSARIVEAMEAAGIVSAMKGSGNRDVLVPKSEI